MPDRDRTPEERLERELRDLGARIEYPATPDLSQAVRRRIEADERPTARRGLSWLPSLSPRWAAAALLLVLALPVLSPTTRDGISDLFTLGQGAGGANGGAQSSSGGSAGDAGGSTPPRSEEDLPSSAAGGVAETTASSADSESSGSMSSSAAEGGSLGGVLGFGERLTLREARNRADAPILLPRKAGPGNPLIYASGSSGEGGIALVYRERAGLPVIEGNGPSLGMILTEVPGSSPATYLANGASLQDLETVDVDGERGYWVPAGSGALAYPGRTADLRANALIWERGGQALRLESSLPKNEAARIAASVR